jgi:hypothetical protein
METAYEIKLSGLRKCTGKVSKGLDTKPAGVEERRKSSSEFSGRELMNNGLGGAHELRVKTRGSPSIDEFGLVSEQKTTAQALKVS